MHEELLKKIVAHANPERAAQQQAYMKSSMPYWGIPKPVLAELTKPIFKKYAPENNEEYRYVVSYLFTTATHREQWYVAIDYARMFKKYICKNNIDLYLDLNMKGQWWDIIDTVSDHLIGKALLGQPALPSLLQQWIKHENMWIQRTALLAQLKYKEKTDFDLLTDLINQVIDHKDFFIRKAIGWTLREYSKTNPESVKIFIELNRSRLSNLSIKEGSKYI